MKGFLIFTILIALCFARPAIREPKANEMFDFVKGFLEGINETGDINKLMKCIKEGETIFKKIIDALNLIKKMNPIDVMKGVTLLVEAIKQLLDTLQPCMEGFNELKKVYEAIRHIDIKKIVTRIITHPGEIIKDITDAIDAFNKKDFHKFGHAVGDLLRRLLLDKVGDAPIVDFIGGFLVGINEVKTIEDLKKCIGEADQIIEKIVLSLKMISSLKFTEMLRGFEKLFEAMLELEMMLRPCLDGFTQFNKLIQAIMHADITELLLRILRNIGPFIQDINDCIESFEREDYKQAGQDIGDILFRLFLAEMKGFNVFDFLKGFLEGINEKGDINILLRCVKDIEKIVEKIMLALSYIMNKDPINLIKGLTLLFEAVGELLEVIRPCSDGFEQIKKLLEAFKKIDILKLVFKILSNPGPYIQDVVNCIEAFKKGDAYTAGKCLGDFLYRLFLANLPGIEFDDFVQMVKGFLSGINQGHAFDDVEKCIMAAPHVWGLVKEAIEEIKLIDWNNVMKDLNKLVEAMMKLIDAFKQILEAVKPCSKVPDEIESIIKKIINMDAQKLLEKILHNVFQIINDLTEAIKNFTEKKYFEFGSDFGDLLYRLILKE
jgi:predicted transcriptional regulator